MKSVEIEWRRLLQGGATCERCGDTGALLAELVKRLNTECGPLGVRVTLKTIALGPERITESNHIRIDGRLLEQLQPQIVVGHNDCPSCGELLGHSRDCPTVEVDGQSHDVPPAWLIRQGVCKSAGFC
jgi:ribosomal protein S27AE